MRISRKKFLSAAISLSLVLGSYGVAGAGASYNVVNCTGVYKDDVHGAYIHKGDINGNTVNVLSGASMLKSVHGADSDVGHAYDNTVNIYNNTKVEGYVTGASVSRFYSDFFDLFEKGVVYDNHVNIYEGAKIKRDVSGGRSTQWEVYSNTVSITGSESDSNMRPTVNGSVFGGYSQDKDAHENKVSISYSTIDGQVYGGESYKRNSNKNKVNISNSQIKSNVHGGFSNEDDVTENQVSISNSSVNGTIFGGKANGSEGDATSNMVTIEKSTVGRVIGGYSDDELAHFNTVKITDHSTVQGDIIGGCSDGNDASDNFVEINQSTVNYVYGGKINRKYESNRNKVIIRNSTVNGSVYGGYSDGNATDGNRVSISGSTVSDNVYGGLTEAYFHHADDNIVTIGGVLLDDGTIEYGSAVTINGTLYGGHSKDSLLDDKNNTLNVCSTSNNITYLYTTSIANLNFYVPNSANPGDTMIFAKNYLYNSPSILETLFSAKIRLDYFKSINVFINKESNLVSTGGRIFLLNNNWALFYEENKKSVNYHIFSNNVYNDYQVKLVFGAPQLYADVIVYDRNSNKHPFTYALDFNVPTNIEEPISNIAFNGGGSMFYKADISSADLRSSDNNTLDGVTLNVTDSGDNQEAILTNNDAAVTNLTGSNPAFKGAEDADASSVINVNAGAIVGQSELDYDKNGNLTVHEQPNQHNASLAKALSDSVGFGTFEMNDIRKRLGDVRINNALDGIWARYENGKNSGSGIDQRFNKFQIGTDNALSDKWRFGGAFSYTKADSTFDAGSADTRSFGVAAYGVYTGKKGEFMDLIARAGRTDHELTAQLANGDLSSMDCSFSAEFGRTYDFGKNYFFEPQAEFTYTHTGGDDFTYNGRSYKLEDGNSFIGRLGFALGYKSPNNRGSIYTRFGLLHEFAGDTDLIVSNSDISRKSTYEGSQSWWEWAIGGQINTSKSTYIYADIEKTFNKDINEDYRLNIGVRYSF